MHRTNEGPGREGAERSAGNHLRIFPIDPFRMEGVVHAWCRGAARLATNLVPKNCKAFGIGTATLEAWAMAGGHGGRFIEKEEFGVEAGLQEFATAAFELQDATDPLLGREWTRFQTSVVTMKTTAAIAEQSAAIGNGDNVSFRCDAVTMGHC